MSDSFEAIVTAVPGPRSVELAKRLAAVEAPGITYLADDFPVFWERASGALVTDVDGNRYLDLTSAFGVAASGHTNPSVAAAIADQAQRLIHGMGDVHPTEVRTKLLEALAALAPGRLCKTYLTTAGSEAIEFAPAVRKVLEKHRDVVIGVVRGVASSLRPEQHDALNATAVHGVQREAKAL